METLLTNLQQIANSIGWVLIHFIWQGSILAACYYAITRLFLKNKIHLHYWTGIFFVILSLIIPIKELFIQLQLNNTLNNNITQQLDVISFVASSGGILNPADIFISLIQKTIPYLVSIWAFVILLISSNLIKSWFDLIKLSKEKSNTVPKNLLRVLETNSQFLKLKFKPIISISSQVIIPATFGFFKPIILLPTSLIAKLPQDQMEAILLHELCHIKRADFIHNIIQLLSETLFFYHPLTRWMSSDVRNVREQCCDELVLTLNTKPMLYATALTNLATIYNEQKKECTSYLQIAATDGELLNRIKFLMMEKKTKSPLLHLISAVLLSIMIFGFFNKFNTNENSTYVSKIQSISTYKSNNNTLKRFIDKPAYTLPNLEKLINSEQKTLAGKNNNKLIDTPNTNNQSIDSKTFLASDTAQIKEQSSRIHETPKEIISLESQSTIPLILEDNLLNNDNNLTQTKELSALTNNFPKLTYRVNPNYSRRFRARGIQGTVILSFNINHKGHVKNIKVDKSSPLKLLDGSARTALKKWRFDSKTVNEQNIKNRYQQIFAFTFDETNDCHNGELGSLISKNNTLCQNL